MEGKQASSDIFDSAKTPLTAVKETPMTLVTADHSEDEQPLHLVKESLSCVHHQIITSPDSVHCGLCHNKINVMAENKRKQAELMEQLDLEKKNFIIEQANHARLLKDNKKLIDRIRELESKLDLQIEETNQLKKDLQVMSTKLVKEVDMRAEVQSEKDKISEELEELTKSLFEEANGMVADEAKKRHLFEMEKKKLESELVKTKSRLENEKVVNSKLRRKISDISLVSSKFPTPTRPKSYSDLKESREHSPLSSLTVSPVRPNVPSEIGEEGSSNIENMLTSEFLPPHDSFACLDIEDLNDQRLYTEFRYFYEKRHEVAFHKLFSQFSILKSCLSEHIEPCLNLGKFSTKKLLEACLHRYVKLNTDKSTFDPSLLQPPQDAVKTTLSLSQLDTRSPSPIKLWQTLTQQGSSSTIKEQACCMGCGKEIQEPSAQLIFSVLPSLFPGFSLPSSASSPKLISKDPQQQQQQDAYVMNLDAACRDRVSAVLDFLDWLYALKQGPKVENLNPVFVEYLRGLKMIFYARIGVLSFFKRLDRVVLDAMQASSEEKLSIQEQKELPVLPPSAKIEEEIKEEDKKLSKSLSQHKLETLMKELSIEKRREEPEPNLVKE